MRPRWPRSQGHAQSGESASGALLAALGGKAEAARAYNELITSWTGIESAAASAPKPADQQLPGFEK